MIVNDNPRWSNGAVGTINALRPAPGVRLQRSARPLLRLGASYRLVLAPAFASRVSADSGALACRPHPTRRHAPERPSVAVMDLVVMGFPRASAL